MGESIRIQMLKSSPQPQLHIHARTPPEVILSKVEARSAKLLMALAWGLGSGCWGGSSWDVC